MHYEHLRNLGKKRHEKNVVHGDVHKHLEHEMTRHKHSMGGSSTPPAYRATSEKNGPTAQLKHSMDNYTPTKMAHGGVALGAGLGAKAAKHAPKMGRNVLGKGARHIMGKLHHK